MVILDICECLAVCLSFCFEIVWLLFAVETPFGGLVGLLERNVLNLFSFVLDWTREVFFVFHHFVS